MLLGTLFTKGLSKVVILIINIYQFFISPLLGCNCRYQPSCSSYAKDCFYKFSPWKASYLSVTRLLRCHPFSSYGYDPVPASKTKDLV